MERKTLSGIKGTICFPMKCLRRDFSPLSISEVSSSCFELLLASFIELECSPSASSAATGESWVNERVLEKIGENLMSDQLSPPFLSRPFFTGFDVGVRMAERCSKDFPKRMGTELQATVSFPFLSRRCSQLNPLLDRFVAVRPLLERSFWEIYPKTPHKQPQSVRDRGPQLPHAVRRVTC